MDPTFNTIRLGNCIDEMRSLPAGCVDLVFADPPFNIGYRYDVYDDKVEQDQYLDWSREWIAAVFRCLKPDGTFWLAIGDEYAAELKLASQQIGFHCRSWVIWYYTFGVNCSKKFTRSHAHLFHFVKDPAHFTFRDGDLDNRIPSARQLVYNDKRANPKGRLPDDTWIIRPADAGGELEPDEPGWSPTDVPPPADDHQTWTLRPQDISDCFQSTEDTWHFPRVAGTFKERAGFHGCQMPEQLLGRIIRVCSQPEDLVVDPFSGSGTTLAVAKKLGRQFLGFDISDEYVRQGLKRLAEIRVGDPLNGSAEPQMSAPATFALSKRAAQKSKPSNSSRVDSLGRDTTALQDRYTEAQRQLTFAGVTVAFRLAHQGYSADRVIADPDLNDHFIEACTRLDLVGDAGTWNRILLQLRKGGGLIDVPTINRTTLTWEQCDPFLFASEIALQSILDEAIADSLDDVLCQPEWAADFDRRCRKLAPGFTSLEYRWGALKLRKHAKTARTRGGILRPPGSLSPPESLQTIDLRQLPGTQGVYVLEDADRNSLYVGATHNLKERLTRQFSKDRQHVWKQWGSNLTVQTLSMPSAESDMLAWQSCFARRCQPRMNFRELAGSI